MSAAVRFSIPHHDPSADYCEPHQCLPCFGFSNDKALSPSWANALSMLFAREESFADYLRLIAYGPLTSIIFRKRPEGFTLCLN